MNTATSRRLPAQGRQPLHDGLPVGGKQERTIGVRLLHTEEVAAVVDELAHATAAISLRRDEGVAEGKELASQLH